MALVFMVVFVVLPYLRTSGLEARSSRQLTTTGERGAGMRLRHARTPFDIVYMWVNGTDPEYAANRAKFGGPSRVGDRDRDNGELLYSLR